MSHYPVSVIATIGPAAGTSRDIQALIRSGMTIARLNVAHDVPAAFHRYITAVNDAAALEGSEIPILLDLPGTRRETGSGHTFSDEGSIPTLADKEMYQTLLGHECRFVALSYVKQAEDVVAMQRHIRALEGSAKVIAKIERREAVEQIDDILEVSHGIMVARGDLGDAYALEELPFVTKALLTRARMARKPAIVATEMLTSMLHKPHPSRADVTDIAQAVLDGASATMLSEETAIGEHAVAAVTAMRKVVDRAYLETDVREFVPLACRP